MTTWTRFHGPIWLYHSVLKCISGNYSIAGNRGHLACFRRYLIELELELAPMLWCKRNFFQWLSCLNVFRVDSSVDCGWSSSTMLCPTLPSKRSCRPKPIPAQAVVLFSQFTCGEVVVCVFACLPSSVPWIIRSSRLLFDRGVCLQNDSLLFLTACCRVLVTSAFSKTIHWFLCSPRHNARVHLSPFISKTVILSSPLFFKFQLSVNE